jgi:hypothetical protein
MGERRNERHPRRVAKKGKESKKRRVRVNNARDSVLREHAAHALALRPPSTARARRVHALPAPAPRRPRRNSEVSLLLLVASRDRVRARTRDSMETQDAHVVVGGRTLQRYAGTRVVRVEVEEAPALRADEVVG